MATTAQVIQFLLSQVAASGITLSGGQAFFFAAGTSTPKTIWIDRNKTTEAANPYTLDANGTAQLYADGVYRVVIKDSNGMVRYDRDYLNFADSASNLSALDAKAIKNVSDYSDLAAAVAAIGGTPTTLAYNTDQTLSASLTIPATLELLPLDGAVIYHATFDIACNSTTARWPLSQIFNGTGAVTGLREAYPEWFGAVADGTTDSTSAVQKAFNASNRIRFGAGTYIVNGVYATKDYSHISGEGQQTVIKWTTGTYCIELRGSNMAANPPETGWMKQPIVENLTFTADTLTAGSIGLSLFGVWDGRFKGIQGFKLDKVVYLKGTGLCEFTGFKYSRGETLGIPNYIIYCDANDGYRNNDNHFHHNKTLANLTHVYAKGKDYSNAGLVDGFFIDNNVFFAGERAVYLTHCTWSNISGNKVFDQLKEGITLEKSGNNIIDGNVVTRAGSGTNPATYYDAITVTGDAAYWNAEVDFRNGGNNQITNNNIYEPSGHAIKATYSSHITIVGNNIFNPNCTIRTIAAGGTPSTLVRDGIYLDYCKGGTVSANDCDSNRQMPAFTSYPEVTHRHDVYLGANTSLIALTHKHGCTVWDAGMNNVLNLLDERLDTVVNGNTSTAAYRNEEFYPEDLTGAGWGTSGTAPTVAADSATAPDGTPTADKVTIPAALGTMVSTRIITVNAGDAFGYAIYLKADTNCIVEAQLTNNTGSESTVTRWLVTGQWKRYVLTHQFAAGTTAVKFLIGNISGKSPSVAFYAWGGFLKQGRTHTVPYMGKHVILAAAPTSGTWKPGDFVRNTGGTSTMGWHRVTLGFGNSVGSDWIAK